VAIQHRMDRALRGDGNPREPARQALADLPRPPASVLALHIENVVLDLKGQLVALSVWSGALAAGSVFLRRNQIKKHTMAKGLMKSSLMWASVPRERDAMKGGGFSERGDLVQARVRLPVEVRSG